MHIPAHPWEHSSPRRGLGTGGCTATLESSSGSCWWLSPSWCRAPAAGSLGVGSSESWGSPRLGNVMPKQWAQKLLEVFFSKCNTNPLMTSSVITCSHMHIALYLQFNTTAVSGQLLYAGQLLRVLSWITDDCSAIWPSLFFLFFNFIFRVSLRYLRHGVQENLQLPVWHLWQSNWEVLEVPVFSAVCFKASKSTKNNFTHR